MPLNHRFDTKKPSITYTSSNVVYLLICGVLQSLVEFFGTLSKEWALECMKDLLLVNLRGNLQIIVQVIHWSLCAGFINTGFPSEGSLTRLYRLQKNFLSSWVLSLA